MPHSTPRLDAGHVVSTGSLTGVCSGTPRPLKLVGEPAGDRSEVGAVR